MKLFPRLRPRERRLALVGLVIFACWMLVLGVVDPLWRHVAALRTSAETELNLARELSALLAQAPEIGRQYEQFGRYLEAASPEADRSALFSALETLARSANVQLNLKPLPVKEEERLMRFPVELDLEGGSHDVLAFTDALLRLPRLIAVDRLRISVVPARESRLRANLVLQQLVLR
ncbi:MAG: type 4a pilus biogenesis protein PilO [Candidatus Omnitrophica bacterium]|nr:type 4a pilus biogenesis protein PilO [Candidatus Omnitrophota bacterium]